MKRILVFIPVLVFFMDIVLTGSAENDPVPLFVIEGLGNGYSTPAITSDRIFVTGETNGTGYLYAYDRQGQLLWKTGYGREWVTNYRGTRASPVVADSLVYATSGSGDIACFDIRTGKKRWAVNMIRELHGAEVTFGYSLPVVVGNGRIYCLPGGADTNIACLDRFTGQVIWTARGNGETPGYAEPVILQHKDRFGITGRFEMSMAGLDADSGKVLWMQDFSITGVALCNKPVYSEGFLYVVQGHGNGAAKYEISADGSAIKKIWENPGFDPYFGGFSKAGQFLFGSSDDHHTYWSVNAETGMSEDTLDFGTGATISSGRDLVLYNKSGKVALVRTEGGKMTLVRSFAITRGTGEHFARPAIYGNRLFIRHGDVLLVYDYRQLIS